MAVGQSISMLDAPARVSGQVPYVLNISLPGMLHARVLRSPYAHARLLQVDTSRAERLPGVVAVLSRDDLLGRDDVDPYFGSTVRDYTPVALDKVRCVGEPVAAVAALDEETAQAALELIDVEYEELAAVFDAEEALKPGAPVVQDGPRRIPPGLHGVGKMQQDGSNNMCSVFRQRKGDVTVGFAEADHVFENVFSAPPVAHVPLEPHVAVANYQDSQLTVWTSNQAPYNAQAALCQMFRLPASQVRVIVTTLGGGYGAKGGLKVEPIAALLSMKARRPVRFALRREEEFHAVTKHGVKIRLKSGVKRDGTIVAIEGTCYFNTGANADTGPRVNTRAYALTGPYRVPNVSVDSYCVYTNLIPAGAFRGFGIAQMAWAHECQMDSIADALEIDPLEIRLRNVLHEGDAFSSGEHVEELHYPELLREAADKIGWSVGPLRVQEGSKIRAKGLSVIIKGMITPSISSAAAKLNPDGSLMVLTSTVEMGQGAQTILAQIAAKEAGVPVDCVRVTNPDTDSTPYDQQTSASRSTVCMGMAVRGAANDVKRQVLKIASDQLEAALEDLEVANGAVCVKGAPQRQLTFAQIVRESRRGTILGQGTYSTEGVLDPETGLGIAAAQWHPAVGACEVEVDTETGRIDVKRFHSALYVGTMINPRQCELQVQGSTFFGLGQALFEELSFDDDGRLINPNLSDYMIPSFKDLPRDLSEHIMEGNPDHLFHGIGETSLPPVMPAIANAVSRALGVRVTDLPLTPEKVLRALQERA